MTEADDKWIDRFGEMVDQSLEDQNEIIILDFREGTMDPEVKSNVKVRTLEFYLIMCGLAKSFADMCEEREDEFDSDRIGDLIDGMLDMLRKGMLEEYQKRGTEAEAGKHKEVHP